jgi:hypothetical protein
MLEDGTSTTEMEGCCKTVLLRFYDAVQHTQKYTGRKSDGMRKVERVLKPCT